MVWEIFRKRDRSQSWFWTKDWQEGEREADADIAAGRVLGPYSDEEFIAALKGEMPNDHS